MFIKSLVTFLSIAGILINSQVPLDKDAIGIMFIVRSREDADTIFASGSPGDSVEVHVVCDPYKIYEVVGFTITEDDTSAAEGPVYFMCLGHVEEGRGIAFSYDSLNVIVQVDSLYTLRMMTGQEGWFGFIQRGSVNKCPVIRK